MIIVSLIDCKCDGDCLTAFGRLTQANREGNKQTNKKKYKRPQLFFFIISFWRNKERTNIFRCRVSLIFFFYMLSRCYYYFDFFFVYSPPPSPPIWFTNDKRWLLFCRVVPCNAQCLLYSASESFQVIIFLSILHLPPPSPSFFCWMNYIYFLGLLQSIQYFFTASMDVDWKYRLEKILKKE